jgi:cell division septation protein DedD
MNRFAAFFILLAGLFAAAPLAAATSAPPHFNTVVVSHFTNASGMDQSPDFIHYFSDDLSEGIERNKAAAQVLDHVVDKGTPVPDAVAANSLLIEGRFLSHEDAALLKPGKLIVEISIYRLSDHALVKTWTATTHFPLNGDHKDRAYAYYTGFAAADTTVDALKSLDLSSISPATSGASPTTPNTLSNAPLNSAPTPVPNATPSPTPPAPSSNTAPSPNVAPARPNAVVPAGPDAVPDAVASVQLSSDPTGAEITIDGNYAGNTPSLIKLKPGTHSIRMTMSGYAPWERSIETAAGESRNFAATLEKTGP